MKLISENRLNFLIRRSKLDRKKQLRISGVSRSKKQRGAHGLKTHTKIISIPIPKVLELKSDQNRRELLDVIKLINETLAGGKRIKLCFKKNNQLATMWNVVFCREY